MTQDELKLVLEALKWCHGGEPCGTAEAIAVVEKALAQPEQKPVACVHIKDGCLVGSHRDQSKPFSDGQYGLWPINTHPPQRTWVGLTDDEIEILFQTAAGADEEVHIRFARAIESKLKELNT